MSGPSLAAVLFTDLVGSTAQRSELGEAAGEELRRTHDRLLGEAVETHGGRVVKSTGDGIMATFPGAAEAVAGAVTVQQAVDRHNRRGKPIVGELEGLRSARRGRLSDHLRDPRRGRGRARALRAATARATVPTVLSGYSLEQFRDAVGVNHLTKLVSASVAPGGG